MEGRHPRVRLAGLVASLSLGVDLGFGQPMEHVLRQCLIALRLAERSALDEQHRVAVYYTALLVNVGCHADAHEQAKWFGDDIALKSGKYAHELGSVRGALATMRLVGAGNPPLYRFRVGLEFALSGHRVRGVEGARAVARSRSGKQFDPALAALLCAEADAILAGLDAVPAWQAVIAAEPALAVELSPAELDGALTATANFVDLKSSFTLGHSVAVGELAGEAGNRLGLSAEKTELLGRSGLVHGYGRLGVSNSIWDRTGPLGVGEWERVRMCPYLTERMLRQSTALAPLGEIAVQHRERLDGSGYPRGLSGGAISRLARVLGGADAYQAMREPRPHRPARSAVDASAELRAEVRAGRLDGAAVDAVLEAAGHRLPHRRTAVAGLTAREIEVLILLARGMSNKQIAASLVITPKTAGNHVEHIYVKIGSTSRAAAALFAVQHGLLPDGAPDQSS
jgi:DNA-binding CsgD family transcriptional regulator